MIKQCPKRGRERPERVSCLLWVWFCNDFLNGFQNSWSLLKRIEQHVALYQFSRAFGHLQHHAAVVLRTTMLNRCKHIPITMPGRRSIYCVAGGLEDG